MKIVEPTPEPEISVDDLKKALDIHKRELKLIKSMSDAQYRAFRTNLHIGHGEESRLKAVSMLESMIGLNIRMQADLQSGRAAGEKGPRDPGNK